MPLEGTDRASHSCDGTLSSPLKSWASSRFAVSIRRRFGGCRSACWISGEAKNLRRYSCMSSSRQESTGWSLGMVGSTASPVSLVSTGSMGRLCAISYGRICLPVGRPQSYVMCDTPTTTKKCGWLLQKSSRFKKIPKPPWLLYFSAEERPTPRDNGRHSRLPP